VVFDHLNTITGANQQDQGRTAPRRNLHIDEEFFVSPVTNVEERKGEAHNRKKQKEEIDVALQNFAELLVCDYLSRKKTHDFRKATDRQ